MRTTVTGAGAPHTTRAALGRLAAIVPVVGAVYCTLAALLYAGMRCDESCSGPSSTGSSATGRWTTHHDAWQWSAQAGLAVLAFACVVVGVYLGAPSRPRGLPALGAGVTLAVGWYVWMTSVGFTPLT